MIQNLVPLFALIAGVLYWSDYVSRLEGVNIHFTWIMVLVGFLHKSSFLCESSSVVYIIAFAIGILSVALDIGAMVV